MGVGAMKAGCDIGIVVRDGPRALAFYQGVLGLELEHELPLPDGGTLYRLLCGDSVFKVMAPNRTLPDPPAPPDGLPYTTLADLVDGCTRQPGYCYVALTVDNLDDIYAACLARDAVVVFERAATRPGTTLTVVADPDGNWIELVQHDDAQLAATDLAAKDRRGPFARDRRG